MNSLIQNKPRSRHRLAANTVLVAFLFIIAPLADANAQQRIALLIGNKQYAPAVGPLDNPHKDIEAVAKSLKLLGFTVNLVYDANFKSFHNAISAHVRSVQEAGPQTISFVYYSGHGAADKKNKSNYLIPVDVTNAENESIWDNSLNVQLDLIDKLTQQATEASHIVAIDACRNELNLTNKTKGFEVDGKAFVPELPRRLSGILIAYAAEEGKTTRDNGIFAQLLANNLLVRGLEVYMVFRNVQLQTYDATLQKPYVSGFWLPKLYLAGNEIGKSEVVASVLKGADPSIGRSPDFNSDCPEITVADYSKYPIEMKKERRCF